MEKYYALVDVNDEGDKVIWTLTLSQLNDILKLMREKGNEELADLGLFIGRSVRANSVKAVK
jgi:hypothetical protein